MPTARHLHHSYADYLSVERDSAVKHEYCDGEIYAMAGGTPEHSALASRITVLLGAALPAQCRLFSSDLKVRIHASGLTTYPDLSMVCGPVERADEDPHAIVNPTLLVDVLSASTEDYDRSAKLNHYKQLGSLAVVLLVSHRERRITAVTRGGETWTTRDHGAGEKIEIANPKVTLGVDDVYSVLDGL